MQSIFSFVLGKDKVCYICIVADRRLAFIGAKISKKKTILTVQIDSDACGYCRTNNRFRFSCHGVMGFAIRHSLCVRRESMWKQSRGH